MAVSLLPPLAMSLLLRVPDALPPLRLAYRLLLALPPPRLARPAPSTLLLLARLTLPPLALLLPRVRFTLQLLAAQFMQLCLALQRGLGLDLRMQVCLRLELPRRHGLALRLQVRLRCILLSA